jgi:hypothetical protein
MGIHRKSIEKAIPYLKDVSDIAMLIEVLGSGGRFGPEYCYQRCFSVIVAT